MMAERFILNFLINKFFIMKPTKIVTHGGTFHADEVSALALIERVFNVSVHNDIPLERVFKVTEEDIANPNVWVLDIGGQYNPGLNNFDHHHDAELPACNVLVLETLMARNLIGAFRSKCVSDNLFEYISNVDCGHIIETGSKVPSVNSLIRACNSIGQSGFNVALDLMGDILIGQFALAEEAEKALTLWAMVEKHEGYAIHDSLEQIVGWHELAGKEDIRFLITPNARGGYQIMSRDSRQWPIPEDERQIFRHNSGFLAVYDSILEANDHAIYMCSGN